MLEESVSIDSIEVNYKVADPPSPKASEGLREVTPLVILHGWGSSSDSWIKVAEGIAQKGFRVIVPDLPGFGKTVAPKEVWGVEEYADFVTKFSEAVGLQKFVLVGHSFGGQTAVQLTVKYPEKVEKLVLVAAAAVRYGPSWSARFMEFLAKILWFVIYLVPPNVQDNVKHVLYRMIRRRDYMKAQGIMKEVFKKVIRQDLTQQFANVKTPTLIIWGEKDKFTPMKDGNIMHKGIARSTLKTFPANGHNLHAEIPEELSQSISEFTS